jgi:uncharacterized membrane protein
MRRQQSRPRGQPRRPGPTAHTRRAAAAAPATRPRAGATLREWLSRAAPWIVVTAAFAVRLYHLDMEPLWFDEAYTAISAVKPVGQILALLQSEGNAPLYYFLLHAWTVCFGDGAYALRLVSALIGAATVPLLYWVGARMFSRSAGLLAAALAAFSPLQVHYSQEVRMYALLPPLALLALYMLYRLLVAPGARAALGFGAAMLAGLYVHYYFLFLLPLASFAVFAPDRRRALIFTLGSVGVIGVGFLPWLPTFLHQASGGVEDWVAEWWRHQPLWYAVPWSLEVLGPGAQYPPMASFKFPSSLYGRVLSLALAAVVLGAAVVEVGRPRLSAARASGRRLAVTLTLGAVLIPLLIAFVVSLLRSPIYVVGRHDVIAWGAYYLLAGAVLARMRKGVAVAAVAVWLGLALLTLVPYLTTERPKRNYADLGNVIARDLVAKVRGGETVVFTASTRTMTQYYLRNAGARFRLVSYPLGTDEHLGWIDPRIRTDAAFGEQAGREFAQWLAAAGSAPDVVWVVAPASRGTPAMLTELQRRGYRTDPERSTGMLLCLRR